jgi:hypothetical protein
MRVTGFGRVSPALAALCLSASLGGCAGVTYGTGTRAEMQTVEDLTGIISLAGAKRNDDIEYRPRGGIVVPPTNALPPVGDGKRVADANWPKDDDAIQRDMKAKAKANPKQDAAADPGFRLPKGSADAKPAETGDKAGFAALQKAKVERAAGAVDANGKPVRRFLTEPPADYRVADPNAPAIEDPKAIKKKSWWPFGKG